MSHLTRGAWIEIEKEAKEVAAYKSHLTRGAWIEIDFSKSSIPPFSCRTSHEVRGLKSLLCSTALHDYSRTSHEVRGLK